MSHKILLVDDEPYVIKSLKFVLEKEGYNVASAANGEEAITKARESKPALMILDIMMPKKSGYEVCQEIKNDPILKDICIIMLTAKGQEADREKSLALGAYDVVAKPFSVMAMVKRAKELLGS